MKSVALLVLFLAGLAGPSWAEQGVEPLPQTTAREALERMSGEKLSYDIAFLWFDRLAVGDFSLVKTEIPDHYRAVLEARTLGVAAWLTSDRVQRYVSDLYLAADGSLRPVRHDADIFKNKGDKLKVRLKQRDFDYARRLIIETVTRDNHRPKEKRYDMGSGPYPYDILAAFYNLRAGSYGPLEGGARYTIPTFAKGKPSEIGIVVFQDKRRPKEAAFPDGGLVVRVELNPEVFDTGDGNLYIWFDKNMRPARVLVKDVIGLGDVRATLHSRRGKDQ